MSDYPGFSVIKSSLSGFLPIVFNLERANQLSPLPDKDLADFCPLIEPYQVTKNRLSQPQ